MSDPIIRRWRDRTIVRILLIPVFALLPIGIFLCIALFGATAGEIFGGRDTGTFFFVTGLMCFVVVAVGGGLGLGLFLRRKGHNAFNEVFEGLGLVGSGYLLSGRKYEGSYGGRQVNVYVYASGSRYNRRPILELFVEAPVGGRMGIGTKNVLSNVAAGLLNKDELEGTGLDGDVVVYSDDKSWAIGMLDASGVRESVRTLMEPEGKYELRTINYMPDSIRLQLTNYSAEVLNQENIRRIFDELVTLAGAVDGAPRPSEVVEASQTEINSRTNRAAFTPIACGIVAFIVLGLFGFAGCIVAFLFMLESGGL